MEDAGRETVGPPSIQVSNYRGRQRRISADGHGRCLAGQHADGADGSARWLRDEEVVGSNPATPTQVRGLVDMLDVAFSCPYSSKVQQR